MPGQVSRPHSPPSQEIHITPQSFLTGELELLAHSLSVEGFLSVLTDLFTPDAKVSHLPSLLINDSAD